MKTKKMTFSQFHRLSLEFPLVIPDLGEIAGFEWMSQGEWLEHVGDRKGGREDCGSGGLLMLRIADEFQADRAVRWCDNKEIEVGDTGVFMLRTTRGGSPGPVVVSEAWFVDRVRDPLSKLDEINLRKI